MIGTIYHAGFYGYCKSDDLKEWYETVTENEEIMFINNGEQLVVNALTIETDLPIYIQILPSNYCLYVNGAAAIDYLKCTGIKVFGDAGTKIKYYCGVS